MAAGSRRWFSRSAAACGWPAGCLAAFSVTEATRDRSPGVSSAAFRAQSPNLRFASLMDMDFTVRCPLVRRLRLVFGFVWSERDEQAKSAEGVLGYVVGKASEALHAERRSQQIGRAGNGD